MPPGVTFYVSIQRSSPCQTTNFIISTYLGSFQSSALCISANCISFKLSLPYGWVSLWRKSARAAIEKAKLLQLPKRQRPLSGELDQNTHIPHSLWCNANTSKSAERSLSKIINRRSECVCKPIILYKKLSRVAKKAASGAVFRFIQGCCEWFLFGLWMCVRLRYCTSTLKYCHRTNTQSRGLNLPGHGILPTWC